VASFFIISHCNATTLLYPSSGEFGSAGQNTGLLFWLGFSQCTPPHAAVTPCYGEAREELGSFSSRLHEGQGPRNRPRGCLKHGPSAQPKAAVADPIGPSPREPWSLRLLVAASQSAATNGGVALALAPSMLWASPERLSPAPQRPKAPQASDTDTPTALPPSADAEPLFPP